MVSNAKCNFSETPLNSSASPSTNPHRSGSEMREHHSSGISRPTQPTPSGVQDENEAEAPPVWVRLGDKMLMDITQRVKNAAKDIPVGTLVKHESFLLHEAVGAIEVMDSRMDTGFLQVEGDSLDDDFDFDAPLSPEQIVYIMDELLCLEVAWHQGHPLLQTVFTSVHIDRLLSSEASSLEGVQFSDRHAQMNLQDSKRDGKTELLLLVAIVLRAYCIAMIVCCDNVIIRVTSGNPIYYEDEDISTNTFNRDMLRLYGDSIEQARNLISAALAWLDRYDMTSTNSSTPSMDQSSAPDRTDFRDRVVLLEADSSGLTKDVCQAISKRLELRALLLDLTLGEMNIRDFTAQAKAKLDAIQESHELAHSCKEAFSDKIQRRLASTQPPRPTVRPEFKVAVREILQLCKDCQDATQLLVLRSKTNIFESPNQVEDFLWVFMSRKPEPHPYTRSYLQSLVILGIGQDDMQSWQIFLTHDLAQTVLPSLLSPTAPGQLKPREEEASLYSLVEDFGQNIIPVQYGFADYFRVLCQNRCRLRRLLLHHLRFLDTIVKVVEEAEINIDESTTLGDGENPLLSWLNLRIYRTLDQVLKLGLEQNIYEPTEIEPVYVLLSSTAENRQGCCRDILERLISINAPVEFIDCIKYFEMDAHREANLGRVIALLLSASRRFGLLDTPADRSVEERIELRFKNLVSARHMFDMSREDWNETSGETPADALKEAGHLLHELREAIKTQSKEDRKWKLRPPLHQEEWINHFIGLAGAVKHLYSFLNKLKEFLQEGNNRDEVVVIPEPEERKMPHWIVPKCGPRPTRVYKHELR